jgi:hypothetical protein
VYTGTRGDSWPYCQAPNYCRLAKNSDEETLPINLETLDVFIFEDDVFDQVQFANAVHFGA